MEIERIKMLPDKTAQQTEFYRNVTELSDRELAEYNARLMFLQTLYLERISNNVAFFFYAIIIPMAFGLLIGLGVLLNSH